MSDDTTEVTGTSYSRQPTDRTITNISVDALTWPFAPDDEDEELGECWICDKDVKASEATWEFSQEDGDMLFHWDCLDPTWTSPDPADRRARTPKLPASTRSDGGGRESGPSPEWLATG